LFQDGKSGLELKPNLQLWWFPPQPPLVYTQPPASPDPFFHRPLFLWMPYRMWAVRFKCTAPGCSSHPLTSCGMYKQVRQVLDIDGFYHLASEYLECGKCHRKVIAWSGDILQQLDVGHRSLFPAILTYRYACDLKVVRLLRERGLGNSAGQLYRKLLEQHTENWMNQTLQYLTACEPFAASTLSCPVKFPPAPPQPAIPKPQWLLSVYTKDVLCRLQDVKARLTSTYGTILKMDSTKKV